MYKCDLSYLSDCKLSQITDTKNQVETLQMLSSPRAWQSLEGSDFAEPHKVHRNLNFPVSISTHLLSYHLTRCFENVKCHASNDNDPLLCCTARVRLRI